MPKIEIEQYKGQTIEYDVDNDKFVCDITIEDRTKTSKRGSLKDLRKEIDTFIKQNLEFKPFKLFEKKSYNQTLHMISVEGVRTDGKFTYTPDGSTRNRIIDFEAEIRSGDEFYYFDTDVIEKMKTISDKETKYKEEIREDRQKLLDSLKKFDISDIKRYTDAFTKS